jgi:hypothetical protein
MVLLMLEELAREGACKFMGVGWGNWHMIRLNEGLKGLEE